VKPGALLYFYVWRLKAHPLQELLAGTGIAVGVALLFAVQIANSSIASSVGETLHGITGSAQIEVASGDEHGFNAGLVNAVRSLPDVQVAAPILQRRSIAEGPRGSQPVELVGVDPSLADLGGALTREFGDQGLMLPTRGAVIPQAVADTIGVKTRGSLWLMVAGRAFRVRVAATLSADQIGDASTSPLVIARLPYAQQLAGMQGLVTQAYVTARPHRERELRRALVALTGHSVAVGSANALVKRLRSATAANDQSTALFSAISALVGLLFAFNAMLLTMPERRRFVADLRTTGFKDRQIVSILGFQALMLGIQASLVGLVIGDVLSRVFFRSVPAYLTFTFPVGPQRIVSARAVEIAVAAGILAALVAAARPVVDLFSSKPLDAPYQERGEVGQAIPRELRRNLLAVSIVISFAVWITVALAPQLAVAGMVGLAVATLLAMPAAFAVGVPLVDRAARRLQQHGNLLLIAAMGTRSAMTRSVAVGAIAAVAVFGTTALDGARSDMVHGLYLGYGDHLGTADIWVTTAGRSLTTDSFHVTRRQLARLRSAPGIASARIYQGGMYDLGDRRIWLIARPSGDAEVIPPSQLMHGNLQHASRLVRKGGWVAVSATLARDFHVHVGGPVVLPTPTGEHRLRVAAIVTNLSWGPGAIVLNTKDYSPDWRTSDPSAIEINLHRSVSPAAGKRIVRQALGATPALDVQTAHELDDEFQGILRDGLTRLQQISLLMIVAAAFALAAAITVSVLQRRHRIQAHRIQGFTDAQLRRILLLEAAMTVAIGCLAGVVAGIVGHLLGDRWLQLTTGFPAHFSPQTVQALTTALLVLTGALLLVSVPGYFAVHVPATTSASD
jgi:putative ABC transport system permease protein